MFDFPVNPRHAALIAAADDYAMDQAALSRNQAAARIRLGSVSMDKFIGATVTRSIRSPGESELLFPQGHVLTDCDCDELAEWGFSTSYIADVVAV